MPSIQILEQARDYLFVWIKVLSRSFYFVEVFFLPLKIINFFSNKEKYVDNYREFKLEKFVLDDVRNEIRNSFKDYMNIKYKVGFCG
jgi:hypothetical protein